MSRTAEGLPELCYAVIPGNSPGERIGIIKRGEKGYHLTDYDRASASETLVEEMVDRLNTRLEVSKPQVEAMVIGSMFGWNVPGADPKMYGPRATR